ncbi:translation initiation factor eIF4e [Dendrothele bispora CBS 962.96]|uniref:Translation initiation factor eIF4e n=1 Tax=Dendrothele bispora (strain CBS 962.96) TaxID=1314807 RepID=A0A4S8L9M9_DENBC|nr:translation initiation factor eIF4e [Dendrothele bispora CBS 962.96]
MTSTTSSTASSTSSTPNANPTNGTNGSTPRTRTMSSNTANPPPNRLPSLNQLAARINISSTPESTPIDPTGMVAPRPRLAAFALRTSSNASLMSTATASSGDSMAVNPPGTRSGSPMAVSSVGSSNASSTETGEVEIGGEALTSDKLEKLNEVTSGVTPGSTLTEKKMVKGYKNIPSLDAITARLAKTRALSIDGSAKPPEPEMIEDPKTPGIPMKAPEHPLQYPWTIYHDTKAKYPYTPGTATTGLSSAGPDSALAAPSQPSSASASTSDFPSSTGPPQPPESTDYEAGLTVIGTFDTVEAFCRYFNWLKPPSKLDRNSNYHLFKSGIKPMWEDPANANGGKWVLTMKNNPALLDRCWSWLAMALVGEELEEGSDEICGAVVSLRSKVDRIQVWTRRREEVEVVNGIGRKLVKLLDVGERDGIGLEFQYNTEERPLPNKFLSIQAVPGTGGGYRGGGGGGGGGGGYQGGGGGMGGMGGMGGPGGGGPVGGGVSLGGFGRGHAHSQSVGGGGVDGDVGQGQQQGQVQTPLSAGPGTFGNFGVGGTNTWRARRN